MYLDDLDDFDGQVSLLDLDDQFENTEHEVYDQVPRARPEDDEVHVGLDWEPEQVRMPETERQDNDAATREFRTILTADRYAISDTGIDQPRKESILHTHNDDPQPIAQFGANDNLLAAYVAPLDLGQEFTDRSIAHRTPDVARTVAWPPSGPSELQVRSDAPS